MKISSVYTRAEAKELARYVMDGIRGKQMIAEAQARKDVVLLRDGQRLLVSAQISIISFEAEHGRGKTAAITRALDEELEKKGRVVA